MLKFVALITTTIVIFWLLARYWSAFRRRFKLAFKAAILVYAIGVVVRLVTFGINADRLVELALVTLAFLACWLIVWAVTAFVTRRRKAA